MAIYELKGKQAKLLELLINPDNFKKSITDICSEVDIARSTFYKWMKIEKFQNALEKARKDLFSAAILQITHQTIKEAKDKSFQDRKMIFEMMGIYTPKIEHDVKITVEKPKRDGVEDLTTNDMV